MPAPTPDREWKTLDSDLRRQTFLEHGAFHVVRPLAAWGLALIFIAASMVAAAAMADFGAGLPMLLAAGAFAGYFAINIGANDIANNMGPAVGSGAIGIGTALAMAAVAESAGALLAGQAVVHTVAWAIIPPEAAPDPAVFARLMLAAMIAAGIWVNIATLISAPVSTTHSVVGGIMGAGIVALGPAAVSWKAMLGIAFGWMATPLVAGFLAAGLLSLVTRKIMEAPDRAGAAVRWVPVLIGLMAGTFLSYTLFDIVAPRHPLPPWAMIAAGVATGGAVALALRPLIARRAAAIGQRKRAIRELFSLPLVMAALIFSFGHGANDVSNAVGPLAAIVDALGPSTGKGVASWELAIGALGISLGILLFGPRLIRVVGSEITRLNPVRSFCVLLAAGATVIAASLLGLPVSSTHTAIGGIFGIGFYREWREARLARRIGAERGAGPPREERTRRRLVRRSHLMTIAAAWMVTVPLSGLLAGGIFLMLDWLG